MEKFCENCISHRVTSNLSYCLHLEIVKFAPNASLLTYNEEISCYRHNPNQDCKYWVESKESKNFRMTKSVRNIIRETRAKLMNET